MKPVDAFVALVLAALLVSPPADACAPPHFMHRTSDVVYTYGTGGGKGCVPGPGPLTRGAKAAIGFNDRHGRSSPLSKSLSVSCLSIQPGA